MALTTTQGTVTPQGVVNYDPNTGAKLSAGQTVNVNQGNSTVGAIPTSALQGATPIVPVTPKVPDLSAMGANANAYISNTANEYEMQRQNEIAQANEKQNAVGILSTMQSNMGGKAADTMNAYNQVDATGSSVNSLAGKLRSINAQSQALSLDTLAKQQAEINKATGQNITSTAVQRNTSDATRDNLINTAKLAMESAIVKADYDTAKSYADQIVDAKYAQQLADIEAAKTNLDNIKDNLTSTQKKLAEATAQKLAKEEKMYNEKIASEKAVNDMLIQASPVAPPDVIAKATEIKNKGGSAVQVAAALGKYGGDFLKNELLKEQIKTQVSNRTTDELQRKKLQAEINSINTKTSNLTPQPTGEVTAPNGDAIGIPNETLSAIGKLKLNEGQANAVAFTSRMIQSAQALDKQLGKINQTGGFYETSGYDPTSAGSAVGRFTGSDQSRIYNTNSQDFIRAKLRKESGAAIGKDEFDADAAIYTPAGAGLDEKDLLLAQTKRDEAIKSMIAQAGPAAPYLQQYYEQSKTQGETFVSENPQLNDWYKNTTNAVTTSTAQAATAGGTYGFSDNQTK